MISAIYYILVIDRLSANLTRNYSITGYFEYGNRLTTLIPTN